MPPTSTVVVFGASGNVGLHVVKALLAADDAAAEGRVIRAVTRDPSALRARLGTISSRSTLEVVSGELSAPGVRAGGLTHILAGSARVFLCLPQALSSADMVEVSNAVSDAAKLAGVAHIVRLSSARIDLYLSEAAGSLERKGEGAVPTQGPLGEAHVAGETYAKEIGLGLTSVRPTSFSSNFVTYDLAGIKEKGVFSSPLGHEAAVNWVTCKDIAAVAAVALLDSSLDGSVLDVTGPPESTLSAAGMKALLERKTHKSIEYVCCEAPPVKDLQALWRFLRAGGFDMSTDVVRQVTGRDAQNFAAFLDELDL